MTDDFKKWLCDIETLQTGIDSNTGEKLSEDELKELAED